MKTISYWAVRGNTDTTEGRGPLFTVARFAHPEPAVDFCVTYGSQWGVFGTPLDPSNYVQTKTIDIYSTVEEACEGIGLETANTKARKQAALAKLTPKERKLLGL